MAHEQDELYWSAFRYAFDELPPDESAAFEDRLSTDQAACEALARVVELSQAVQALPASTFVQALPTDTFGQSALPSVAAVTLPLDRRGWMQPVGWMSIGVAACLAVIMTIQSLRPQFEQASAAVAATSGRSTDTLALAWYRTHDAMRADASESETVISNDVADSDDTEHAGTEVADLPDVIAPNWLLAAISAKALPPNALPSDSIPEEN